MKKTTAGIIAILGILLVCIGIGIFFRQPKEKKLDHEKNNSENYSKLDEQYFNYPSARFYFENDQNYWIQKVETTTNKKMYIAYATVRITSNLDPDKTIYSGRIEIKKYVNQGSSFEISVPITLDKEEMFTSSYTLFGKDNDK